MQFYIIKFPINPIKNIVVIISVTRDD